MDNILLFDNHATYADAQISLSPTVSYCVDMNHVHYNKTPKEVK